MPRKKDFTVSPLNPFAAAEAAATEILGIIPEDDEQQNDSSDVDDVVNVEQQNQQSQQEESSDNEQRDYNSDVDDSEQQTQDNSPKVTFSRAGDKPAAKTPKRTFPGKQHMHLILPNELAEAVKLLAKVQNKSVNTFMTDLIETHMEDWKPIVDQLGRLDKNIGVKSSKKKLL